jgi:S1-C subfamily serine protease
VRRVFLLVLITLVLLCLCLPCSSQEAVPMKVKAALFDRDLNQKPIAKFRFAISPLEPTAGTRLEFVTSFEGTADISVPPGRYEVSSSAPLEFQGKAYSWKFEVKISGPQTIEISNDNASITAGASKPVDDLVSVYKTYRDSVVTVLAEYGPAKGTGFIIDASGLVLTNQHVVKKSDFIAVQIDEKHRLPAILLGSDSEKDIAVLWVNLANFPNVKPVQLLQKGNVPAEEGEKVFTIGSPLHQSKVMTTGIVSKVEARAIISDVNINHGNSGGPLFNSNGSVIGITTFGDLSRSGGPGISGIVRIEEAFATIDEARKKQAASQKPSAGLLLTEPEDKYPLSAIKASALVEKFNTKPYVFSMGDYDVAIVTPIVRYRRLAGEVEASKSKAKRNRNQSMAVQGTFEPLDDLKGWEEYVGEYEPTILVQVSPKLKEGFWSAFGRGMAASHGYAPGPASLHFKTDFYRMKLTCADKEVIPILPGKAQRVLNINNAAVRVTDATFDGFYEYPYDAIRPDCGKMTMEVFSEKNPNEAKVKVLDEKTITAVYADFEPYRKQLATGTTQK